MTDLLDHKRMGVRVWRLEMVNGQCLQLLGVDKQLGYLGQVGRMADFEF